MKSARFIRKALTTSNTIFVWPAGTRRRRVSTDYDLSQHQKASGKSLEYFEEETKQKFIPHVVEPSAGSNRTVLALICEAYSEDESAR